MDIILSLSQVDVEELRAAFLRSSKGGMSEEEFVQTVLKLDSASLELPSASRASLAVLGTAEHVDLSSDKPILELSTKLVQLFDDADTSGDGIVTWEEMFASIVSRGAALGSDGAESAAGSGAAGTDKVGFRLHRSEQVRQNTKASTHVQRVRFLPGLHAVAVTEHGAGRLRLFRADVSDQRRGLPILADAVPGEGVDVQDADYIPEHRLLCCASADFSIQVFDASPVAPSRARFLSLQGIAIGDVAGLARTADEAVGADSGPGEGLDLAGGLVTDAQRGYLESIRGHAVPEEEEQYARAHAGRMGEQRGAVPRLQLVTRVHTPRSQSTIRWMPGPSRLLTAGMDHRLCVWSCEVFKTQRGNRETRLAMAGTLDPGPSAGVLVDIVDTTPVRS